jgi:hypothetical protein
MTGDILTVRWASAATPFPPSFADLQPGARDAGKSCASIA